MQAVEVDWERQTPTSRARAEQARRLLPDGVASPVRGGTTFSPYPFYTERAEGAYLYDVDGNRYLDTVMAFGPVILGHAHPAVTAAVQEQAANGLLYGTCTPLEVEVAQQIVDLVPSVEMVRFVPSGTEATMHAIRVARGYTGKPKILKFEGHYHGNHDGVLVSVSAPLEILGTEASPVRVPVGSGIPEEHYEHTLVAVWNDLDIVEKLIRRHRHELAAVITEPIMANKGFIPPDEGYLQALQQLCTENDVLFILDEVITGFRLAPGGAQEFYGLSPDLSTFAKAMANGAPIGAFGGRREVMSVLEGGQVRHAGTYNATPLGLAAARATLKELSADAGAIYRHLDDLGAELIGGLQEVIDRSGVPGIVQGQGSMFQIYFTGSRQPGSKPPRQGSAVSHQPGSVSRVRTYRDALRTDQALFSRFAHEMIYRGVFVHPDMFEHWFLSAAHTRQDVDTILQTAEDALRVIARTGTRPG